MHRARYDRSPINPKPHSFHHHRAQSAAHCSVCTPPCYARISPCYVSTPACSDVILNVPAVCATARLPTLCNVLHPPDSVLRWTTPASSDLYFLHHLAPRRSHRLCSLLSPTNPHCWVRPSIPSLCRHLCLRPSVSTNPSHSPSLPPALPAPCLFAAA
jgi:hypothetical protein